MKVSLLARSYIVLKDKIPLSADAKQLEGFKQSYDKLYELFKEKLLLEYAQLRIVYEGEYEQNFH